MIRRVVATCLWCSCVLLAAIAGAQPADSSFAIKARVLDILFPLDTGPTLYISKMVLRFGDSDTQLVVVTYPGARRELIRYSLAGVESGALSQLISGMVAENAKVTDREIAARVKVDVSRSPVNNAAFNRALDELKKIRISPVLRNGVSVDEFSDYGFWYDTWQESVHYTLTSPPAKDEQSKLCEWMKRFRARVPDLLKVAPESAPAKPRRVGR